MEGSNFTEVVKEALRCALIAVDEKRNIISFPPQAENLLQLSATKVLHQPLSALPIEIQEVFADSFDSRQSISNRIIRVKASDGFSRHLRVNTVTCRREDGHISSVIALLSDESVMNSLADSMHQLDRLASIGTLAASMAHEIKNALVPVRTFVDLLLNQNKDAELASVVIREMRRVESLVGQMLKFAGPAKPTFVSLQIHEILDHALQLIRHQVEGLKIHLSKSFQAHPAVVLGDTYQLEQTFLNLLLNAIESMGPNGKLKVSTDILPNSHHVLKETGDEPEHWIRIAVADTGTGVMEENLDKVFEPFFTTKPNGTGLGLTITRRIVQEHQGQIQVTSKVNQGTTFSVLFPLAASANPPAGSSQS